uniref:Uncharacterized protein n=1 Tax=Eiseniibacteriota bacterium TaxID=2212470 RepID=A0A832I0W7_UNCEI
MRRPARKKSARRGSAARKQKPAKKAPARRARKVAKRAAVRARASGGRAPARPRTPSAATSPLDRFKRLLAAKFLIAPASLRLIPSRMHCVVLYASGHPDRNPTLSKGKRDRVMWHNLGQIERTLRFTIWPFEGEARPIVVPANGWSESFAISAAAENRGYEYSITPPPDDEDSDGGPPGGPEVIGDD